MLSECFKESFIKICTILLVIYLALSVSATAQLNASNNIDLQHNGEQIELDSSNNLSDTINNEQNTQRVTEQGELKAQYTTILVNSYQDDSYKDLAATQHRPALQTPGNQFKHNVDIVEDIPSYPSSNAVNSYSQYTTSPGAVDQNPQNGSMRLSHRILPVSEFKDVFILADRLSTFQQRKFPTATERAEAERLEILPLCVQTLGRWIRSTLSNMPYQKLSAREVPKLLQPYSQNNNTNVPALGRIPDGDIIELYLFVNSLISSQSIHETAPPTQKAQITSFLARLTRSVCYDISHHDPRPWRNNNGVLVPEHLVSTHCIIYIVSVILNTIHNHKLEDHLSSNGKQALGEIREAIGKISDSLNIPDDFSAFGLQDRCKINRYRELLKIKTIMLVERLNNELKNLNRELGGSLVLQDLITMLHDSPTHTDRITEDEIDKELASVVYNLPTLSNEYGELLNNIEKELTGHDEIRNLQTYSTHLSALRHDIKPASSQPKDTRLDALKRLIPRFVRELEEWIADGFISKENHQELFKDSVINLLKRFSQNAPGHNSVHDGSQESTNQITEADIMDLGCLIKEVISSDEQLRSPKNVKDGLLKDLLDLNHLLCLIISFCERKSWVGNDGKRYPSNALYCQHVEELAYKLAEYGLRTIFTNEGSEICDSIQKILDEKSEYCRQHPGDLSDETVIHSKLWCFKISILLTKLYLTEMPLMKARFKDKMQVNPGVPCDTLEKAKWFMGEISKLPEPSDNSAVDLDLMVCKSLDSLQDITQTLNIGLSNEAKAIYAHINEEKAAFYDRKLYNYSQANKILSLTNAFSAVVMRELNDNIKPQTGNEEHDDTDHPAKRPRDSASKKQQESLAELDKLVEITSTPQNSSQTDKEIMDRFGDDTHSVTMPKAKRPRNEESKTQS